MISLPFLLAQKPHMEDGGAGLLWLIQGREQACF